MGRRKLSRRSATREEASIGRRRLNWRVLVSRSLAPVDGLDFHPSSAESFAGIICIVLGLFVFFRRAVWRNQEKRGAGLLSLDLNRPRNYLAPDYVLENESTNVFLEPPPDED